MSGSHLLTSNSAFCGPKLEVKWPDGKVITLVTDKISQVRNLQSVLFFSILNHPQVVPVFGCLLPLGCISSVLPIYTTQGHPTDRFGGISVRKTCNRLKFSVREILFSAGRDKNDVLGTKIGQLGFSERQ